MFVDIVKLSLSSGRGGEGCTSFRKEKFVVKGGPDGGDGGKGGDLLLLVSNNTDTLSSFAGKKHLKAKDGIQGGGARCSGKSGDDLVLKVPPGTQVFDDDTGELLHDLTNDGDIIKLLIGGKGGLGNYHFKSSRNQTPHYHQPGLKAITLSVRLELKLIADVGLVGFPNVGKSTLISTVSNAKPHIANYEFTTLIPNLGVVKSGEYTSFVMADIPGIIEGASVGRGLGLEFLRHIQRTKTVLYMLDVSHYIPVLEQFATLNKELEKYSKALSKNSFAVVISKIDTIDDEKLEDITKEIFKFFAVPKSKKLLYKPQENLSYYFQDIDDTDDSLPYFIMPISSATNTNTKPLCYALQDMITNNKNKIV